MLKSKIALFIAAIILASSYPPGQAVFAKESPAVTASDGVAPVTANSRYGTFESTLSLLPGSQYCYKISISNLDSKAAERYIYVALPRYFKNLPEEYTPQLIKIKDLPKPSGTGKNSSNEQVSEIKIEKNFEGLHFPSGNQLPPGKFTRGGDLKTAEVIRLDLTGLKFAKGTHDLHFIFEAPQYESIPSDLNYGKHSFYIYEKIDGAYFLTASSNPLPRVRYATLSEAELASPDSIESPEGGVLLQPGDFYNYRIKVKKPARNNIENHFLLVALPAFYETLGEESAPFLAQESGLTVTGLSTETPPLFFSGIKASEGVGDPIRMFFTPASIEEYTPSVTLIKIDLSSAAFIDEEALFDFSFQVPSFAPLDVYPADISKKDRAIHSFALYEFSKEGDLLYKSSLKEEAKTVLIKQNPLVKTVPPFPLQASDSLFYDGSSANRASVEGRILEILPGSEYLYKITMERLQTPEGFTTEMHIPLPAKVSLGTAEILTEGLELEYATSTEENSIKINFDKAAFTADRATLSLPLIAPDSGESYHHNFILSSTGADGEKYIVTNEEPNLAQIKLLPPPVSDEKPKAEEGRETAGTQEFTDSLYGDFSEQVLSPGISGNPFSHVSDISDTEVTRYNQAVISEEPDSSKSIIEPQRAIASQEPIKPQGATRSLTTVPQGREAYEDGTEVPTGDGLQERKENPATKHEPPPLLLFLSSVLIFLYCGFEYRRRLKLITK